MRGVYLFFLFLLQNIDCGFSLEPPRRVGFKGVHIARTCFPDVIRHRGTELIRIRGGQNVIDYL